jgi:MoxR-like ATPase
MPFRLLTPTQPTSADELCKRQPPPSLTSHQAAAQHYVASEDLIVAINTALHLCAPLLLTGEPGTGKTQVAHYLAWRFGIPDKLFQLDVRSTTTCADLLYEFDSVAYFRDAQGPRDKTEVGGKYKHVRPGPLWKAIDAVNAGQPAIVLLDEIDKAPRDFPNDILTALDQGRFRVPEWDKDGQDGLVVARKPKVAPPILVITSNSERRLPEAFLRRCVFHHIAFTDELVRAAIEAHSEAFAPLSEALVELAIERFGEIRTRSLRKKPATAELLAWLIVLSASHDEPEVINRLDGPLDALPYLSVLVKDRDDLGQLR